MKKTLLITAILLSYPNVLNAFDPEALVRDMQRKTQDIVNQATANVPGMEHHKKRVEGEKRIEKLKKEREALLKELNRLDAEARKKRFTKITETDPEKRTEIYAAKVAAWKKYRRDVYNPLNSKVNGKEAEINRVRAGLHRDGVYGEKAKRKADAHKAWNDYRKAGEKKFADLKKRVNAEKDETKRKAIWAEYKKFREVFLKELGALSREMEKHK